MKKSILFLSFLLFAALFKGKRYEGGETHV